jgi:hypothetical protein
LHLKDDERVQDLYSLRCQAAWRANAALVISRWMASRSTSAMTTYIGHALILRNRPSLGTRVRGASVRDKLPIAWHERWRDA